MATFKVLGGVHKQDGKTFKKDETFESDKPLDQLFDNKFERVSVSASGVKSKKTKRGQDHADTLEQKGGFVGDAPEPIMQKRKKIREEAAKKAEEFESEELEKMEEEDEDLAALNSESEDDDEEEQDDVETQEEEDAEDEEEQEEEEVETEEADEDEEEEDPLPKPKSKTKTKKVKPLPAAAAKKMKKKGR
jgi:hypothetical protein